MGSYRLKHKMRSLIPAVCILLAILMAGCGKAQNSAEESQNQYPSQVNESVTDNQETDSTEEATSEKKIYWTLPVEDYEVFLQDGTEEDTLDLWVNRKGEKQVMHTYQKYEGDYQEPEDITADTFEDVLGHDGFRIYCKHPHYTEVDYYAAEEEMERLAYYWGVPDKNVWQVDVDGDGIEELICNVQWIADGACDTLIFHFDGEKVFEGAGSDLLREEHDSQTPGMIVTEYLPEKDKVLIRYSKDGEGKEKEYDIDLKKLELYEVPQNI